MYGGLVDRGLDCFLNETKGGKHALRREGADG